MARARIKELYFDRGYLEAEVDPPLVRKDDRGHITITYKIREGIRYRFGEISLTGFTRYPESELRKFVNAQKGDLASQGTIEMSATRLADYYGKRGYPDTIARPQLELDRNAGIATVKFVIKEG